jgi:uncharacterized protein
MYPNPQEQAVIDAAEKIMIDTMARYDPSHDKYHGQYLALSPLKDPRPLKFKGTDILSSSRS